MAQTRSDGWTPTFGASAGPILRTRTDEIPSREMQVPVPMFMLAFASASGFPPAPAPASVARPAALPPPPPEQPAEAVSDDALPEPAEAEATGEESEPAPTAAAEPHEAAEPPPAPAPGANRIELIIDSLPRHQLTEPLPVTIESLGDQVFTASIGDLGLATTGNTVGEALLLMKEQIVSLYEELTRRPPADAAQHRTLEFLQHYIGRGSRKQGWYHLR